MVVRISRGTYAADRATETERLLRESESVLRPAIEALPGLQHYFVGVDRKQCSITNVSVWETMDDAQQMDSLPQMKAQRPLLEAAGVTFDPISNQETLWSVEGR